MQWFRYYSETLRDPKVLKLTDKDFRFWVTCLCVACDNDGHIPAVDGLKVVLNKRLDHVSKLLERLCKVGLIDALETGYMPHGWEKRQYKSDTSTDRVHKHRAKRNVSVTASETPPDTDTDTEEINKEKSPAKKQQKKVAYTEEFEELWKAYPKRPGGNPKESAFKAYKKRLIDYSHEDLLNLVSRYAKFCEVTQCDFIQHTSTFFGGKFDPDCTWSIPVKFPTKQDQQYPERIKADVRDYL